MSATRGRPGSLPSCRSLISGFKVQRFKFQVSRHSRIPLFRCGGGKCVGRRGGFPQGTPGECNISFYALSTGILSGKCTWRVIRCVLLSGVPPPPSYYNIETPSRHTSELGTTKSHPPIRTTLFSDQQHHPTRAQPCCFYCCYYCCKSTATNCG